MTEDNEEETKEELSEIEFIEENFNEEGAGKTYINSNIDDDSFRMNAESLEGIAALADNDCNYNIIRIRWISEDGDRQLDECLEDVNFDEMAGIHSVVYEIPKGEMGVF